MSERYYDDRERDTDYLDIHRSARQLRQEEQQAGMFSLAWMGRNVVKVVLFAAFCFWLKAYSVYISPGGFTVACPPDAAARICWTVGSVTDGLLSVLLLLAGAAASAFVAPMLIASVLPNNAMMQALDRLEYKYGWVGKSIAIALAMLFLRQSYVTLWDFWASRPNFTVDGELQLAAVKNWAVTWTLLFTVVPAWMLNRLTSAEWIVQLLGAREAARVHTMIDLEQEAAAAVKARARAVLYADVAVMLAQERALNVKQVTALLAGVERGVMLALRRALSERDARSHLAMTMFPNDAAIIKRHQQIADTLSGTMADVEVRSTMVGALAEDDRPPATGATIMLPTAETVGSADVRGSPPRTSTDRHGTSTPAPAGGPGVEPPAYIDTLTIAFTHFGMEPFKRVELQQLLKCERSHASEFIADWKRRNYVTELTKPKFTYVFRREVASWLKN